MPSKYVGGLLLRSRRRNPCEMLPLLLCTTFLVVALSGVYSADAAEVHLSRYDPSDTADVIPYRRRLEKRGGPRGLRKYKSNTRKTDAQEHESEDYIWNRLLESSYPSCSTPGEIKSREESVTTVVKSAVVDDSALNDVTSPQSRAAAWLVEDYALRDPCVDGSTKQGVQRFVLATFYFSTSGDSWRNKWGWMGKDEECNWGGVVCNSEGDSISLNIDENGLTGPIPAEISRLTSLTSLALDSNSISSPIPLISSLTSLEVIDLDNNELTGKIPDWIFGLSLLRVLDLNHNSLTGTLSDSLGGASNLSFVQLHENDFTGVIPNSFGDLELLETLTLHGNGIVGTVPASVCELLDKKLYRLTSDCSGADPKVVCTCCTLCY